MSLPYHQATFLLSVAKQSQLPADMGYEVAIVGRSNAGKSSVLNKLTSIKQLARVSKTPGRTQLINVFQLDDQRRLVDLPGYGFARVPLAVKAEWGKRIDAYLNHRQSLQGLLLIMDIRHPFRDSDQQMIEYCLHQDLPVHILLNKSDKMSRGAAANVLQESLKIVKQMDERVSVQLFSAMKGVGLNELYVVLDQWYQYRG